MSADREDIFVPFGVRPMVREHLPTILIAFDLPHDTTDSGDLETQFEPADSGEERADSHATRSCTASIAAARVLCSDV